MIDDLKLRARELSVVGGREYNPGWHLALDLPKQLLVSEAIARASLTREESRGGHTRDDYPAMDPNWRKVNLVCRTQDEGVVVATQPLAQMRAELAELFDAKELSKYMTEEELSALGKEKA